MHKNILQTVEEFGEIVEDKVYTYLGRMTHRIPHVNIRSYNKENMTWRKQSSSILPDELDNIFLPQDFYDLAEQIGLHPLVKAGMKEDPEKNIAFLKQELLNWTGLSNQSSQAEYEEMWDDIPNVSQYSTLASERIPYLVDKLDSLLNYKSDTNCRSFELRFPSEYCPIVWSFILSPDRKSLEGSLVFRSVEVSRNILNDLYLFYGYFGYIFSLYTSQKLFEIPITALNFFAQDAHIIDFTIKK